MALRTKLVRIARDLNLAALSQRTGIHPATLSLIERGRLVPTPSQLDKLATVLGVVPAEALLEPVTMRELQVSDVREELRA